MAKIKVTNTYLYLSVLLILCLLYISCGKLSEKTADEAFSKENPTYTIVSSVTGEGWDGVEYRHIAFKKPGDEQVYKEIWTFERQDDGSWKVTGRWTPKE